MKHRRRTCETQTVQQRNRNVPPRQDRKRIEGRMSRVRGSTCRRALLFAPRRPRQSLACLPAVGIRMADGYGIRRGGPECEAMTMHALEPLRAELDKHREAGSPREATSDGREGR